jgi:hypothetical protein
MAGQALEQQLVVRYLGASGGKRGLAQRFYLGKMLGTSCKTPSALPSSNITTNSASINWSIMSQVLSSY